MNPSLNRNRLRLIVLLLVLVVLYWLSLMISRIGETKVAITAIPSDSKITVNGRPIGDGTAYLKPGKYTFVAKSPGFKDDEVTITLGKESAEVGLIPSPNSDAARQLLKNNPRLLLEREGIAGQRANQKGQAVEQKTPIINLLPYTDIAGPFSIDYGPSPERKDGIFLIVSDSSSEGRTNALKWIAQQGYDPTDLEIRFYDFVNPLTSEGQ